MSRRKLMPRQLSNDEAVAVFAAHKAASEWGWTEEVKRRFPRAYSRRNHDDACRWLERYAGRRSVIDHAEFIDAESALLERGSPTGLPRLAEEVDALDPWADPR